MMLTRLFRTVLPPLLACTFGLQVAHADIYTWTDENGTLNISNLTPPEGVHVTKVVHEDPNKVVPAPAVSAAPSEDVQALANRVQQLEQQLAYARSQPPPPVYYPPAPPPMQYDAAPMQYSADVQQASYGCDPSWAGCAGGWLGYYGAYPFGVVVVRPPHFHRPYPFNPGHRVMMQRPTQTAAAHPRR